MKVKGPQPQQVQAYRLRGSSLSVAIKVNGAVTTPEIGAVGFWPGFWPERIPLRGERVMVGPAGRPLLKKGFSVFVLL